MTAANAGGRGSPSLPALAKDGRLLAWLARAMLGPVLLAAVSAGWQAGADSAAPSKYDAEAAYLCNFGKFTHWPATARRRPMYICIFGQDPFGHTIDDIASGEKIDGRPVLLDRMADGAGVQNCSILFLGAAGPADAPGETRSDNAVDRVIASVAGKPVLTVSDLPDFLDRGGEIQFILENGRVRFAVNLNAVNRNGLTLESELLKVAIKVIGEPGLGSAR
jgi:hypothetical protein